MEVIVDRTQGRTSLGADVTQWPRCATIASGPTPQASYTPEKAQAAQEAAATGAEVATSKARLGRPKTAWANPKANRQQTIRPRPNLRVPVETLRLM